jgi:type IV secretory pathway VirB6-like protein
MKTNTTEAQKKANEREEAKKQREEKSRIFQEKRLLKAVEKFETLKNQTSDNKKGLANKTLSEVHTNRANNATIEGLITATIGLIKEVAKTKVDKNILGILKKTAANVITSNVNSKNLALYIDNKGNYKTELIYRMICSTTKNEEVKTILNNLKKQAKTNK